MGEERRNFSLEDMLDASFFASFFLRWTILLIGAATGRGDEDESGREAIAKQDLRY